MLTLSLYEPKQASESRVICFGVERGLHQSDEGWFVARTVFSADVLRPARCLLPDGPQHIHPE